MALNYSQRPVFPPHISEDNLRSPTKLVNWCFTEGVPEKNGEGYGKPWQVYRQEFEDRHINIEKDRADLCSHESNSRDIVDLLPSDPFGMDIQTTVTAISGWLEDLEATYGGYLSSNNGIAGQENCGLFSEWSTNWNNGLKFQPFCANHEYNHIGLQCLNNPQDAESEKSCVRTLSCASSSRDDANLNFPSNRNQCGDERDMGVTLGPYDFGFQTAIDDGGVMESTCCISEPQFGEKMKGVEIDKEEGALHEAWNFTLSYLGVKELLSVEKVCKSLRVLVKEGYWLWMSIHIDQHLKERITDGFLLQLANRANGNLMCLSLVECLKITDDGIRHVLETNPRLCKLFVPGCTRLTVEGILNNIKIHNSNKDFQGIKHLRIGGTYGFTSEHFEDLKKLLGPLSPSSETIQKPHFYRGGNFYLPFDDDRTLDIEVCPRCEKHRLVYDCPAEGCRVNGQQACRACTLCIARCAQCGRCISDYEYEETFCLDLLCLDCFEEMAEGQNGDDTKVDYDDDDDDIC